MRAGPARRNSKHVLAFPSCRFLPGADGGDAGQSCNIWNAVSFHWSTSATSVIHPLPPVCFPKKSDPGRGVGGWGGGAAAPVFREE